MKLTGFSDFKNPTFKTQICTIFGESELLCHFSLNQQLPYNRRAT